MRVCTLELSAATGHFAEIDEPHGIVRGRLYLPDETAGIVNAGSLLAVVVRVVVIEGEVLAGVQLVPNDPPATFLLEYPL